MKKFLFAFAVAGIALVSCNKEPQPEVIKPAEKIEVTVGLTNVDLSITETRADLAASADEKKVDEAYILVYGSDGKLVDYKAWSGTSVKFSLDAATYKFYAIINTGITTMPPMVSALNSGNAQLKNDLSGFTMLGYTEKAISTGTEKISITAKRVAAKIIFNDLKVNFDRTDLQNTGMTLNAVYVINAAGQMSFASYFGTFSGPSLWYNKMKYESGDCDSFLYAGNLNTTVANNATANVNKTFYVYPNETSSDAHGGNWSARKTRLVLEATVGGSKCYYPFTFDSIESNKIYTVKTITVTRKGMTTPDDPWNDDLNPGEIVIDSWEDGGDYSESM